MTQIANLFEKVVNFITNAITWMGDHHTATLIILGILITIGVGISVWYKYFR